MTSAAASALGRTTSPVELEILRTRLVASVEELAAVLAHSAPTVEVGQAREFCIALCDVNGSVVAIDNALELASIQAVVGHVGHYFEFDLSDGDTVLTNDPSIGGSRVQDITLVTPFFVDGDVVAYVAVRTRIGDIGGQISGNINPEAGELLAEGVVVTPVKIQRFGRPVRDIVAAFLLNGRRPDETRRTLTAALAVLEVGKQRLADLLGRHGISALRESLAYAQTYSEQIARSQIRRWAEGDYSQERGLKLATSDTPVVIRLRLEVGEDSVHLDFSDSDEQSAQFINSPAGVTGSCAMHAVLAVLGDRCPPNGGVLRVVDIATQPGTVVDPLQPAAVGWGGRSVGAEVTDLVAAALQSAAGRQIPPLTTQRPVLLCRPAGDRSTQIDLGRWAVGGASANSGSDGWGAPNLATRGELPSVEQWEADELPRLESFEYAVDSSGAGANTGAPSVEVTFALPADHLFTLWTDSLGSPVPGTDQGHHGLPGRMEFETATGWERTPAVAVETPLPETRLRMRLAGGGGLGQPERRDPDAVRNDLADGLISAATATAVYRLEGDISDD